MKFLLTLTALTSTTLAVEWVNISDSTTSKLKPGYAGPTAGVVVDPASSDVFMVVNDLGLWRSSDQGKSFSRCDGEAIGGRCETGWALQADPAGKRIACFMIYGSSAMTTDGGTTWTKFTTTHLDFGAVDWADSGRRMLALRHESGGLLTTSEDGGAMWKDLQKGWSTCGVVDHTTFVATKENTPGIFRSTDAGATWAKVSEETPTAGVPVVFKNVIYWPNAKGLLISKDKGASWNASVPVEATHGPIFGGDAAHFVLIGKSGFTETKDGGRTWMLAAPLPAEFTTKRVGPNFAWDPRGNVFYASTMTKPTFAFPR